MTNKKKIIALCGSTRQSSSNLNLIHAISTLASAVFEIEVFEGLSELPHFNPDHLDPELQQVADFRERLRGADAILICTPEYAVGVPGSLKNAIDWTVSSMEFSQKPVALITASTSGFIAHQSLLGTLLIIESRITEATQLVIPAVKTKVNAAYEITDPLTLELVKRLIQSLEAIITGSDPDLVFLPAPSLR